MNKSKIRLTSRPRKLKGELEVNIAPSLKVNYGIAIARRDWLTWRPPRNSFTSYFVSYRCSTLKHLIDNIIDRFNLFGSEPFLSTVFID